MRCKACARAFSDGPAFDLPQDSPRIAPAHRADGEHDARERSTTELDAPSASQALGCCKHESSSRAADVARPLADKTGHAGACRGELSGARNSPIAGLAQRRARWPICIGSGGPGAGTVSGRLRAAWCALPLDAWSGHAHAATGPRLERQSGRGRRAAAARPSREHPARCRALVLPQGATLSPRLPPFSRTGRVLNRGRRSPS
jgi:hypothetical protein